MILKRILTRKSILGFGNFTVKDLSVQMLLDSGQQNYLIVSYYNYEKIDFEESILDELGITKEYRISKPGKSDEMRLRFFSERLEKMSDLEKHIYNQKNKAKLKHTKARINSSISKYGSKEYLRAKNHGHR